MDKEEGFHILILFLRQNQAKYGLPRSSNQKLIDYAHILQQEI